MKIIVMVPEIKETQIDTTESPPVKNQLKTIVRKTSTKKTTVSKTETTTPVPKRRECNKKG